jgi:phage I-like protein
MVVDYEHQVDDPTNKAKGPVRAASWIKELIAKADGIWGRVEWTRTARNMIADREYRYLSPVLIHRPDGTVMRIKGLSLVHRPNLELTALSNQEDTMSDTTDPLSRIATALGLQAEAGLIAILSAIDAAPARPDPAKYVPIEAVQELMASPAPFYNGRRPRRG